MNKHWVISLAVSVLVLLTVIPLHAQENRQFADYAPWYPKMKENGWSITDFHIHFRGGMTTEKAIERTVKTGITSGILENYGRDWPIANNDILKRFITTNRYMIRKKAPKSIPFYLGIQVNDRNWYNVIDPELYQKLDYVLADTMIMDYDANGRPQRLWLLPKDHKVDLTQWFQRYMKHNLDILSEPIDILANPTYLPPFAEDHYNELWTPQAMKRLIEKAVKNNIALEIQAESAFPKPEFIRMAKQMGAKFTFGSNNMDAKLKDLTTWHKALTDYGLTPADLWTPDQKKRKPLK